jgi:cobalamin biosynthesis Mg chelatase CobN
VFRSPTSHRILRLSLAFVAFVMLSAVVSSAAMAKTETCAKQVVADWYDDGRIGKIYPLECYRDAIKSLPPDVRDYSNAKEEIGRALAFAKLGKPDPGGEDPTPPTSTGTPSTDTSSTDGSSGVATVNGPGGPREVSIGATETDAVTQTATETTDTSGPSSVPIPLLVLGGLAVVLLAAGSAGYLRRRLGSDGDDDGTPPASA